SSAAGLRIGVRTVQVRSNDLPQKVQFLLCQGSRTAIAGRSIFPESVDQAQIAQRKHASIVVAVGQIVESQCCQSFIRSCDPATNDEFWVVLIEPWRTGLADSRRR